MSVSEEILIINGTSLVQLNDSSVLPVVNWAFETVVYFPFNQRSYALSTIEGYSGYGAEQGEKVCWYLWEVLPGFPFFFHSLILP